MEIIIQTITPTKLKSDRNWTNGTIKKFLGEPDEFKTNPYYKSGSVMQLYYLSRVQIIEDTPEFQMWQSKYLKRKLSLKEAANKAVKTKTKKTFQKVQNINIKFPKFKSKELLIKTAITHYENLWSQRGDDRHVTTDAPEDFIKRITLNFLRHSCTNYDELINEIQGCTGINYAISDLHNKIITAAKNKHQWLK